MDTSKFRKQVEELAEESLKLINTDDLTKKITKQLQDNLVIACMTCVGFEYDSWGRKYKIPSEGLTYRANGASLYKLLEDKTKAEASRLMGEIDFSVIELTDADKKAVITAYKRARREALEKEACRIANIEIEEETRKILNSIAKDVKEKTPKKSLKLIESVFSGGE